MAIVTGPQEGCLQEKGLGMLVSEFELPDRSESFCQAIALGHTVTRSAVLAGFSVGHARNLMARPDICGYLAAMGANIRAALKEAEKRGEAKVAAAIENPEQGR